MVDIAHANAYNEVLEILKYISKEDYNKIPKETIEVFEKNANKEWSFKYNPNLTLDEQHTSKIAKTIIAILFRDYWATEDQKQKIISKQIYDMQKLEEEKQKKYNVNNIFRVRNQSKNVSPPLEMIEYKESIIDKIINKIKNIFHKN